MCLTLVTLKVPSGHCLLSRVDRSLSSRLQGPSVTHLVVLPFQDLAQEILGVPVFLEAVNLCAHVPTLYLLQ